MSTAPPSIVFSAAPTLVCSAPMGGTQEDPFELSQEETQVMLGRYAGATVSDLAESTGMPANAVQAIVSRLTALGLLGDDPDPGPGPGPGPDPDPGFAAGFDGGPEPAPVLHHADDDLVALLDAATLDLLPDPNAPAAAPARRTPATRPKAGDEAPAAPARAEEAPDPDEEDRAADAAEKTEDTREYRKLYETELHPKPVEERVALAKDSSGSILFALCFDPVPAVIMAIFENVSASVEHARLIAFNHRDPRGLEEIAGRPQLAADPLVHRRLVRNPGTTEPMLRRLVGNKRLIEIHKLSLDRELPDRSRAAARALLRTRWTSSSSEERVDLIWRTEGRVLTLLAGLTFDSRMTAILCGKTFASMLLIQNLARFPATPPQLLAMMLRQPLVKRQPHLRNAILQHQNTPSDAKKRV